MIDELIFKAYDIRGFFPDTLTKEQSFFIGKAFGALIKTKGKHSVCVGHDNRFSSVILEEQLVSGIKESGIFVYRLGAASTPEVYFAEYHYGTDAAVIVTGSHGAKESSGFKFSLGKRPLFGKYLKENFLKTPKLDSCVYEQGKEKKVEISYSYTKYLARDFSKHYLPIRNLKVIWDPGNGVTSKVLKKLIAMIPGEHRIINGDLDTTFPNHHPDPSNHKNLEQLSRCVKTNNADLGIAFDADGDRIGIVKSDGMVIPADLLSVLFLEELRKYDNVTIIGDVKCTKSLFNTAKLYKFKTIMSRTGHSFIKSKLYATQAKFACESSGHIYFYDRYFGFDDAFYAAIRLIGILSITNKNLIHFYKNITKMYTSPEIRLKYDTVEPEEFIDKLAFRLSKENKEYCNIDGIRVDYEYGWWLIRKSNTEKVLSIRLESLNKEGFILLSNELKKYIPLLQNYNIEPFDSIPG